MGSSPVTPTIKKAVSFKGTAFCFSFFLVVAGREDCYGLGLAVFLILLSFLRDIHAQACFGDVV